MSSSQSDSSLEFSLEPIPLGGSAVRGKGSRGTQGGVWLDGDVLACRCPDCGAPMSIRLWLMVADCFRCGASVELSEEQEQEALHLLREHEAAQESESREVASAITPTALRKPKPTPAPKKSPPPKPADEAPAVATRPRRVAASEAYRGARAHVHDLYEKGGLTLLLGNMLKDLPAWLVSLVIHLVAMILMGLWMVGDSDDRLEITLSTSVGPQDMEGNLNEFDDLEDPSEFDDPGAVEFSSPVEEVGAAEAILDFEPVEVPFAATSPDGNLFDLGAQAPNPFQPSPAGRMLEGRDPTVRAAMVEQSGGTSETEAAVARGLKFLARHQHANGNWSLDRFHKSSDCDKSCSKPGRLENDVAATAMALLPFLGAGQTHREGEYTSEVLRGLNWLVEQQNEETGDLRGVGQNNTKMYAHGQAAIVLCEAYALTGDPQLRGPAQMALNFIVKAQHSAGGWRYRPGEAGDTSVVGWQLMALKSGQMAYLRVPPKTFELAGRFLDSVHSGEGRYIYHRGSRPTPTMTAEALLCRQYLGAPHDDRLLGSGVDFLVEKHLPDARKPNIYYWYYGTQMMHHYGGEPWDRWNAAMQQALLGQQERQGHSAGSWTPEGQFSSEGGRIYMTALATCILEVYYRHMPLYGEGALERVD